ncbi:beta-ketoacyl synthase N-terminal-like domain-containing protein [Streptomyces cupreus]|uniref:Beta-ketoacyl synthase-like N-terminal domain-containing protein n=1 Tax=Streptomyces cupreus TaxID=2759956 RepID=A0A7X1MAF9_9ACTN|nr:beta-ketoacyl synthase N-terminal-like domain-containing protein [Streptomyces cupreus]MBC2903698.1 hypothetical protein [Streptomyces cupreus]
MTYDDDDGVLVTGTGFALSGVDRAADLWTCPSARFKEPFEPADRLGGRRLRYKDRATRLGLAAVHQVLRDARLQADGGGLTVPGESTGVVVSSNLGNVDAVCAAAETIASDTAAAVSPMELPNTASNVIASWIAIRFGLRGASLTLCNGPTSGLDALFWAWALVRAGRVERAVVVGVEPTGTAARLLAAAHDRRPDDGARLLDGAVALVAESARAARRRGIPATAALSGFARRADLHEAVARARGPDGPPVGVWLVPEGGSVPTPEGLHGVHTRDLSTDVGHCSGALGVLQCAAATAYLSRGGPGCVLATAGGHDDDDAAAAVVLTAPAPSDDFVPGPSALEGR